MNNAISFQFTPTIFAAKCNDQLILLDAQKDQYIALNALTSKYLTDIVDSEFILEKNHEQFDTVITYFIQKKIIEPCENPIHKKRFVTAISPIGLHKRDWMPPHRDKKPKIRFREFLKALMAVRKAQHTLKTKKLEGIITLLQTLSSQKKNSDQQANLIDVNRLAYTLDNACLIFPKKTLCLPWATALACLLLKQGIRCSFVIGVQACPFYAHAWIEVEGEIINDNPELRERLAPILKLSL